MSKIILMSFFLLNVWSLAKNIYSENYGMDIKIKLFSLTSMKINSSINTKKVSNISELKNTNGSYEGQEVTLMGYYTSGDKRPITYKYTNARRIDDGGSVINSSNGSWVATFNDTIKVSDFGCKPENKASENYYLLNNIFNYLKNKKIKKLVFDKSIEINETIAVNNISNLTIDFNNETNITGYRGFLFSNCNNLTITGNVNGKSLAVVGLSFTNCPGVKIKNLKITNIGNNKLNQVRGLEFNENCSNSVIENLIAQNIISKAVAVGIVFNMALDKTKWSKDCIILNSRFINIQPSIDGDGIKTLQMGLQTNLRIINCYFENCAKRAIKLQSRGDYIDGCTIVGSTLYPIDFQDGNGTATNINLKLTNFESLFVIANYNVNITNVNADVQKVYSDLNSNNKILDLTKANWSKDTSGYIYIKNFYTNMGSFVRVANFTALNLSFENLVVGQNKYPYLIDLTNSTLNKLTITKSNLLKTNNIFYSIVGNSDKLNDCIIKDNYYKNKIFDGTVSSLRNKNNDVDNISYNNIINKWEQKGTKRIFYSNTAPSAGSNRSIYYSSKVGDEVINTDSTNIIKWICTSDSNGTSSIGTWKPVYR